MRVTFLDFVLDTDAHELRQGSGTVAMEPQVFDVLAFLIVHRDRLVPKTELLDEVWGDQFVSESALTSRIKSARRAVGDTGRDQRIIKTIHGRGYRFVAPAHDEPPTGDDGRAATPPTGLPVRAPSDGSSDATVDQVLRGLAAGRGTALSVRTTRPADADQFLGALTAAATDAGAIVGRGSAAGRGHRTFGCVLEALDELTHRRPALLDVIPARCRSELERTIAGEPPSARSRVFLATRELLQAASATAPVVLLFEDLGDADGDTVDLVDQAARLARQRPIAVVMVHDGHFATEGAHEELDLGYDTEAPAEAYAGPGSGRDDAELPEDLATALTAVAVGGTTFDDVELAAATGRTADEIADLLDEAFALHILDGVAGGGYRFRDPRLAAHLVDALPPHRRAAQHRATADRLAALDPDPARVADHLLAAGDPVAAVRPSLAAARRAAGAQLHREVVDRTATVLDHASGDELFELLSLRADAQAARGDAAAVSTFRRALSMAPPELAGGIRARMARYCAITGDLATAVDVIDGVEPTGGPDDGMILLAQAIVSYFQGDLDRAEELLDTARDHALAPGVPGRLLDIITMRGLIAHDRGEFFDQLRRELRATEGNLELASTIFDSHLCVAEYLLYGLTPYQEVVELAGGLRAAAETAGTTPAAAFATCIAGEAELLAGNLHEARRDLHEAVELFRSIDAVVGTAHALQRLAETELAAGNRAEAERLARESIPPARWSPMAHHLLQRAYGILIAAAADPQAAADAADEARDVLGERRSCEHCEILVALPSAIAYAEVGRLDDARVELSLAEESAHLWEGPARPGAVAEARAVLARAEGDEDTSMAELARAITLFEQAGHPLDVARCREARGH